MLVGIRTRLVGIRHGWLISNIQYFESQTAAHRKSKLYLLKEAKIYYKLAWDPLLYTKQPIKYFDLIRNQSEFGSYMLLAIGYVFKRIFWDSKYWYLNHKQIRWQHTSNMFLGLQHRYFWEMTPSHYVENDDEAKSVLN